MFIDSETEELLLSRIASGTAAAEDWLAIERAAAADSNIWERLARTLHDQSQLQQLGSRISSISQNVDIPAPSKSINTFRTARLTAASGWLSAAAITLIAVLVNATPSAPKYMNSPAAGPGAPEVIGELPNVLVETHSTDGKPGVEIIYVRRTLEKKRVNGVFEIQHDDIGRPVPIPTMLAKNETKL
ncbi:MAG: hypothetical protein ACKVS6_16365 [Planctomycetota bacterium]